MSEFYIWAQSNIGPEYKFLNGRQNAGQNHSLPVANKSFENVC